MRGSYPGRSATDRRRASRTRSRTHPRSETSERWLRDWSAVNSDLYAKAEAARLAQGVHRLAAARSPTRNNLDRIGDLLLDTDGAWVLLGRTIERPRAMVGPMAKGRGVPPSRRRSNDRLLADRMVWQYPWYWSAGVLGGLGCSRCSCCPAA